MATILIVDDEPATLEQLRSFLSTHGHEIITCPNTSSAWEHLRKKRPDLVILDVWFSNGPKGVELLERMNAEDRTAPTIMMSGAATIDLAVKATKLGAFDFLEKPFSPEKLHVSVSRALEMSQLEREVKSLKENLLPYQELLGSSEAMNKLREEISRIADSRARVLIIGENGTGKELVARAIHEKSSRRNKPFVKVNCAAIPKELVESELFGHEKGAFTGALSAKKGRFELAESGTLFLDEIGDMDLSIQAKLLRFLETGEIERVGAVTTTVVDVRLLAATNKNLSDEMAKGNFREDLYYRLSVVPVHVPPLRERLEDVPELTQHFLRIYCGENSKPLKVIEPQAVDYLSTHSWPGNVRELRNLVERLVITVSGAVITREDVAQCLQPAEISRAEMGKLRGERTSAEREAIQRELEQCKWKVSLAAERLGIDRTHLYRKMKQYGIKRPSPDYS